MKFSLGLHLVLAGGLEAGGLEAGGLQGSGYGLRILALAAYEPVLAKGLEAGGLLGVYGLRTTDFGAGSVRTCPCWGSRGWGLVETSI